MKSQALVGLLNNVSLLSVKDINDLAETLTASQICSMLSSQKHQLQMLRLLAKSKTARSKLDSSCSQVVDILTDLADRLGKRDSKMASRILKMLPKENVGEGVLMRLALKPLNSEGKPSKPEERIKAIEFLASQNPRGAVDMVLRLARFDKSAAVRQFAWKKLVQMGKPGLAAVIAQVEESLRPKEGSAPAKPAKKAKSAKKKAVKKKPAKKTAAPAIEYPEAIAAITEVKDPEVKRLFRVLAYQPNLGQKLCGYCIKALGTQGDKASIQALCQLAIRYAHCRSRIARILAGKSGQAAENAVMEIAQSWNIPSRNSGWSGYGGRSYFYRQQIEAVAKKRGRSAVLFLIQLASRGCTESFDILRRMSGKTVTATLIEAAMGDPSSKPCRTAQRALRKKGEFNEYRKAVVKSLKKLDS